MSTKRVKKGASFFLTALVTVLIGCPGTEPGPGNNEEVIDDPDKIVITFDLGGAEGTPPAPITLTIDPDFGDATADTFPGNPGRAGYVFTGWYDGDTKYSATSVFTQNITLTAKWNKLHTVSFNTNGGDDVPSIQVEDGKSAGTQWPANPVKAGNTFLGWFAADSSEYTSTSTITGDISLSANWFEGSVVSFDYGITSLTNPEPVNVAANGTLGASLPVYTSGAPEGFSFEGWYDGSNQYSGTTVITATLSLKAKWSINGGEYVKNTGTAFPAYKFALGTRNLNEFTRVTCEILVPASTSGRFRMYGPYETGNWANAPAAGQSWQGSTFGNESDSLMRLNNTYNSFSLNTAWTWTTYNLSYNPTPNDYTPGASGIDKTGDIVLCLGISDNAGTAASSTYKRYFIRNVSLSNADGSDTIPCAAPATAFSNPNAYVGYASTEDENFVPNCLRAGVFAIDD
jgi:uncharacterized repeat protein (TIGR02543 family)